MSVEASSPFWALFGLEVRLLVRDKRTLFASVLLPLLVTPLFFFATSVGESQREERLAEQTFSYGVRGSEAEAARDLLRSAKSPGGDGGGVTLEEVDIVDTVDAEAGPAMLDQIGIHVLIEAFSVQEATAGEVPGEESGDDGGTPAVSRLSLVFLADWDASNTAVEALEARLRQGLLLRQDGLLADAGFTLHRSELALIAETRDVATASQRTGAALGRWATLFFMLFLIVGGSVVAADTLAGEKERGTLETLLGTAASRREIIGAKLAAVFALGVVISGIQLLNLGLYAGLRVIELPADFSVDLGVGTWLGLVLLLLPLALLTAAALLWVSGRSSTYKAFQIALLPLMLVLLAPTAAAFLPGLDLRSVVAAVPVAGIAVAVRELMVGHVDIIGLALAWLSTLSAAALLVRACLLDLSSERLTTATDRDRADHHGGIDLLSRRVFPAFAVGWALIFLASAGLGLGLRGQVLFNIVGVFFGGSLLLLARYELAPRETLALRPVCPSVWSGVLLGAPATFFLGAAVAEFSGRLFPLPQDVLETLGRGILPAEMSLLELIFFVAILPGVCEEVAFRGVLLQALRRRMAPVSVVLVSAGVFAAFHFEWVRLLPTFFLGVLLAALTLMTRSLWPAILWHVLNNASAILSHRLGLDVTTLAPSMTAGAAVVAALSWFLIWRGRPPGPGLDHVKPPA